MRKEKHFKKVEKKAYERSKRDDTLACKHYKHSKRDLRYTEE